MKSAISDNDIFVYFEIIRQVAPESVLDYGMFLKHIGALTRQVKDMSFSYDIDLCGVDTYDYPHLGVYDMVYDRIVTADEMAADDRNYTLAMFMHAYFTGNDKLLQLLLWAEKHAAYAVFKCLDTRIADTLRQQGIKSVKPISLENDRYFFVTF